jgi:hypothetical protein
MAGKHIAQSIAQTEEREVLQGLHQRRDNHAQRHDDGKRNDNQIELAQLQAVTGQAVTCYTAGDYGKEGADGYRGQG